MDDAPRERPGEIEVSPEEERFLKRFFRRQMLPWAALLLVIPVTLSLALRDDDGAEREARSAAALAQLRTENQKLREDLAGLAARLGKISAGRESDSANELERRIQDANQGLRALESRVASRLEQRLDVLEARLVDGEAVQPGAGAPPPEASAWDVSAILDRLYALELAQQQAPAGGAVLRALEERVGRLESAGPVPAAPEY